MGLFSNVVSIVDSTCDEQNRDDIWEDSIFSSANELKNDYVGKAGERIVEKIFNYFGFDVVYNEDKIEDNGTYDILINDKKVEVKTARVGKKGKTFQHENLRSNEDCDYYCFIDIMPNSYYISILEKENMNFGYKHPVFGVSSHNRRKTENTYKFDLNVTTAIKRGIEKGITMKVEEETDERYLEEFLVSNLMS